MVNQSKEKPIERGCRISEERGIISVRGWGGRVTRGDLHERVMSCGVHSTPWEEWDLITASAQRPLLRLQWRGRIGSANHPMKNCSSWRWNTHRAGLFIFLWPQTSGPLFHPNCFASSCCHFPGTVASLTAGGRHSCRQTGHL